MGDFGWFWGKKLRTWGKSTRFVPESIKPFTLPYGHCEVDDFFAAILGEIARLGEKLVTQCLERVLKLPINSFFLESILITGSPLAIYAALSLAMF
jgi:hypothetical protein